MYSRLAAAAAVALFSSAAVVVAQIPGLPDCAQTCVTNFGSCNPLDVQCICTNQALLEQWSCCVNQDCDSDGVEAVITFANSICGSEGVTGLPSVATCAPTGSATPSATESASMTGSDSMTMTDAPSSETSSAAEADATEQSQTGTSSQAAAAAPTNMAQKVLGLGIGAAGLLAAL